MNDHSSCIELILEHQMPADEAKAFKLVCIYLELAYKFLPNYQHPKLPKGDPRKCELFRYCYKLTKEFEGKFKDEDYKFYIKAQFDILRNIIDRNGMSSRISPNCLVGEKAWGRWLKWKSKYDKQVKFLNSNKKTCEVPPIHLLKKELNTLKHYFSVRFNRFDKNDIYQAVENGSLFHWITLGRVPIYYLLLSPLVKQWIAINNINLKELHCIDTKLYENYISDELQTYFKQQFSHEF